jgi:hypothetical protein
MSELRWFRLHTNSIDNVKLRMLAFEDRWHYIAICCLKAEGLLDKSDDKNFSRMIAIKLGVQALDLEEVKRRLMDVGLIDDLFQPVGWSKHQYLSDNSAERVRKHRAGKKETTVKRFGNVTVTPPETETETDTETETEVKHFVEVSTASEKKNAGYSIEFEQFWKAYPSDRRGSKKRAYIEWRKVNADRGLIIGDLLQRTCSDRLFIDDGGKFVPHAERWLSGERWESGIRPVSQYGDITDSNIETAKQWLRSQS